MLCPKEEEALVKLFYNFSTIILLFLLFSYFSLVLLAKFFYFIGTPIFPRNQYEYEEYSSFTDEKEEDEDEQEKLSYNFHIGCKEQDHLVADIIHGGDSLLFLDNKINSVKNNILSEESVYFQEIDVRDQDDQNLSPRNIASVYVSPQGSEPDDHGQNKNPHASSSAIESFQRSDFLVHDKSSDEESENEEEERKMEKNVMKDEKFLIFGPSQLETKKFKINDDHDHDDEKVNDKNDEEIFGETCTVGSTSKSSSEWRSSINYRDSATEDPFSSSSRRSCPKWESYTVFQKYDEEMLFLDRISAQKLHETESLRSIEVCPRSISERIMYKFANKKASPERRHNSNNPFHELEAAYVAEICLTWEALNCNYKNFEKKRASRKDLNYDPGCPAKVAQQFQQFQVLLQRYIENEPYENGRRPEIYARMRLLAPKLLQVPEYRDDEQKDMEGFGSRISSPAFLMIMEDGIRTFMNFLRADREKPFQVLSSFFKRKKRGTIDPTLLQLMKKVNQKKKMKLKDLRRARKCQLRRRRRSLKVEEEMEVVMGLIDLEVVSRVLRMADLSEEQLHWCEEKMSRVRISEGKLHRDSLPLFFPAQ